MHPEFGRHRQPTMEMQKLRPAVSRSLKLQRVLHRTSQQVRKGTGFVSTGDLPSDDEEEED